MVSWIFFLTSFHILGSRADKDCSRVLEIRQRLCILLWDRHDPSAGFVAPKIMSQSVIQTLLIHCICQGRIFWASLNVSWTLRGRMANTTAGVTTTKGNVFFYFSLGGWLPPLLASERLVPGDKGRKQCCAWCKLSFYAHHFFHQYVLAECWRDSGNGKDGSGENSEALHVLSSPLFF